MYNVACYITTTKIAFFFIIICATFGCLSRYLYSNYKLIFGTLYPAYASYKAIKRKDVKQYTRWMMYWVCYGAFSATEFIADIFLSFWFPFYYEVKILFILWLLSSYGNGAKILYKAIIHPELDKREIIIDSYIEQATCLGFESLKIAVVKFSETINAILVVVARLVFAGLTNKTTPEDSPNMEESFASSFLPSIISSSRAIGAGYQHLLSRQNPQLAPAASSSGLQKITEQIEDVRDSASDGFAFEELDVSSSDESDGSDEHMINDKHASCTRLDEIHTDSPASRFAQSRSSSSFCLNDSRDYYSPAALKSAKNKDHIKKLNILNETSRPRRRAAIEARSHFKE
ncbi:uncharacterized protein LOC141854503 [Brevipalpus obovatus]|uniref:uncharacterized protein LOC141854503 n=1 Tax=Brevipalpus obovatus TaxID=246614 RepID=UPI003D9F2C1C